MKKLIILTCTTLLLIGCKSTKNSNCDAYSSTKNKNTEKLTK